MNKHPKSILVVATVAVFVAAGLILPGLCSAGELDPSAGPGPTMKTLDEVEPRIPISSLPYTISSSGSYYITGDLTSSGGIIVRANNVTIDLMGYSLIGLGSGTGIYMGGYSNVEVRNGTVRGFYYGIRGDSSNDKGHRIIGIRVVSSGGIYLNGTGHLVKDCTAADNGYSGIYVGSHSTVTGNTAYNNQSSGIVVGAGSTVTGNTAYNNRNGISVSAGCTLTGNTAYDNQEEGIRGGYSCTVIGNTARNNQSGLQVFNYSLVDQNVAEGNTTVNIRSCPTCIFGVNYPNTQ